MGWTPNTKSLSCPADTLITDTFAAKFVNWIFSHLLQSGDISAKYQLNGDTGNNYAYVYTGGGVTSNSGITPDNDGINKDKFIEGFMVDVNSEEKVGYFLGISKTTGAGNAPDYIEEFGKYVPSPAARITSAKNINTSSGDMATDSNITDLTTD